MRNLLLSVPFFLVFSFSNLQAQDTLRTKKDTLIGKVMEIGIDIIRYTDINNLNGPVISILKSDVIEIRYANGSKFLVSPDPYEVNKIVEVRKKTKCIKFEFFSPLTNDIAFGYETMLNVGKNLEFKVGIIGPGTAPNNDNVSGFFFKGGIKFLISPSFISQGVKYAHGLHGGYIKPEFIFNTYTKNRYYTNYNPSTYYTTSEYKQIQYTNICFNIVFGKQLILGNAFTFEYYGGIGYGLQSSNSKNSLSNYYSEGSEEYSYSHLYLGPDFPMILTGGITLGVIF